MNTVIVTYCSIDRLFYLTHNGEEIHHQQAKPTVQDAYLAYLSDQWEARFAEMRAGMEVRVSERIYESMLGAVPPKKHTGHSFFAGECFTGSYYYYFEKRDGFIYGSLRHIVTGALLATDKNTMDYIGHTYRELDQIHLETQRIVSEVQTLIKQAFKPVHPQQN